MEIKGNVLIRALDIVAGAALPKLIRTRPGSLQKRAFMPFLPKWARTRLTDSEDMLRKEAMMREVASKSTRELAAEVDANWASLGSNYQAMARALGRARRLRREHMRRGRF